MSAVNAIACASIAVVGFALYAWAQWVTRRHNARAYRLAARGVLVGTALLVGGALWTMQNLATASRVAPQDFDAGRYAQSVSASFVLPAIPIGLGNLLLLASVMTLVIGTLRRPTHPPG